MDLRRATAIVGCLWLWSPAALSAAELEGRVRWEGPVPAPVMLKVDRDQSVCGETQRSEQLIVSSEGFIQNAVMFLPEVPAQPAASPTMTIDQQACAFVPHVLIVPPGGMVRFLNSDPAVHEIRAFRDVTMLMRFTMPPRARPVERGFDGEGPVIVRCGLHPWMHAWVYVAGSGRYTITDAQGRFHFSDVPEGSYALHVWHERLGRSEQRVTIRGQRAVADVRLGQPTEEGRE